MITKIQANQAANELIEQQNAMRAEKASARNSRVPRYMRSPELNRLTPEQQSVVVQSVQKAVTKDWVMNLMFIMVMLSPLALALSVLNEKFNLTIYFLWLSWATVLFGMRRYVMKRAVQLIVQHCAAPESKNRAENF